MEYNEANQREEPEPEAGRGQGEGGEEAPLIPMKDRKGNPRKGCQLKKKLSENQWERPN